MVVVVGVGTTLDSGSRDTDTIAFRYSYQPLNGWDMEEWYDNTRYGKDLDCDIDYDKLTAKIGDTERIYNIEEVKI